MLPVSAPGWAVIGVAFLVLLGVIARQIVPYRKQAADAEAKLRDDLIRRVEDLEKTLGRQTAKMERQERRHAAEQRIANHSYKNVNAAFDAMLMMLKMSPDRVPEIIAEIEKMRTRDLLAEAKEKAVLIAAFAIDDDKIEIEDIEAALEAEPTAGAEQA